MFNIIRYIFLSFILVIGLYGCGTSTESSTQVENNASSRAAVKLTGQIETVNDDVRVTLRWTSENIDFCIASGAWSGEKTLDGEEVILNPGENKKYEISCATALDPPVTDVVDFTDSTVIPSLEFIATQVSVEYGGSTELSWSAENVNECIASDGWTGNKGLSGSMNLQNLVEDQVYTLNCSGDYGLISSFVVVLVDDPVVVEQAPVLTFTTSSSQVAENTSFKLSWNSSNASECEASGEWGGPKATSGSEEIPFINISSHFVLQCKGPGGITTRAVDVVRIVETNTSGTALLSWTAPTQNTDNTTLIDLAGYRIYYGTESGNYSEVVTIETPGITEYLIENLSSGQWYFVMTSFNAQSIESSYSEEVSININQGI